MLRSTLQIPGQEDQAARLISQPAKVRSTYQNLLQIGGATAVIGYHVGLFGTAIGHFAVALFFVIAGSNMARSRQTSGTLLSYTIDRIKRFVPELSVIWLVCLICFALVSARKEFLSFLLCSALLENFIKPFLDMTAHVNWMFIMALWFVAALIQLQIFLFLIRGWLSRAKPLLIFSAAIVFGMIWKTGFAAIQGQLQCNLNVDFGDSLYRMPFTHVEAIIFGFLLGRGSLKIVARYQIPFYF